MQEGLLETSGNQVRSPPNITFTITFSCQIIRAPRFSQEGISRDPPELQNHIKAYDILRRNLVEELAKTDDILKGELEADETYFSGKERGVDKMDLVISNRHKGIQAVTKRAFPTRSI
ncbi:MAG TPA: hypothetical protein PK445_10005 [Methanolinea sp.]|nr:hypothetical protein [Methanolinea sp.]